MMEKREVLFTIILILGVYFVWSSLSDYIGSKPGRYQIINRQSFKHDGNQYDDRVYLLDSSTGKTWYLDGVWRPIKISEY